MKRLIVILVLCAGIGFGAGTQSPQFKNRLRENLRYAEPPLPPGIYLPAMQASSIDTVPVKIDSLTAVDTSFHKSNSKKKKRKNKQDNIADTTDPWKPKSVTKPVPYNSYREKPKPQEETPAGDILRSIITDKKKN